MTSHEELLDNVAAYAVGALPEAEAASVEAHLRGCEQCRAEYAYLRPAVTAVAYSAEACADTTSGAVAASPLLKARIMRQVRSDAAPARAAGMRLPPAYWAAAACLAIAILAALTAFSLNRQLRRQIAQSAVQSQTIADLTSPQSQRHAFGHGEVITNADRLYITMHGLATPPPGRVYQAWTLAKGATRMTPSVTFAPEGGVAVLRLPQSATDVAAVAVSVEPDGGSQQPTTKPIVIVKM
jgi:anti-sigma-K factor RskA